LSSAQPAFIGVDWGTSSFRAYLVDARGGLIEQIGSDRGILSIAPGAHEGVLAGAVAPWKDADPTLPIVMSGMIGARQGWIEAPYANCPAGVAEIAAAVVTIPTQRLGRISLAPGVSRVDAHGGPDVMRGEETQILGALAALKARAGLFVLPGTHSKWARVEDGRIMSFASYMTGEVFAALKDHTILGRLMSGAGAQGEGFAQGVGAAARLERPGDLLHAIFMTRTLGLFDRLGPDQLADYLSGLLVGAELLAGARGAASAVVIGSPSLTARYCKAGELLGLRLTPAPDNCVLLGQFALLERL